MTASPVGPVAEVLSGFEVKFRAFADAFAEGQYVLWVGSGVSRKQMPSVDEVIVRVIELLRRQVDPDNDECAYGAALTKVLNLSSLSQTQRLKVDLTKPVGEWETRDQLVLSLTEKYSQVLGVRVRDRAPDYLLWEGPDVPNTYGNPDRPTGVEHLCIAILMLEGVADSAATSNWDGLIEKAMSELSTAPGRTMRVVVESEEFRLPQARATLIKFHGCAIRAVQDPEKYRPMLVAQERQISGWSAQPENKHMSNKLQSLLAERNTLVLGLSIQDANMHTIFAESAQNLGRTWPAEPPALVLAEPTLHSRHEQALQLIYGDDFDNHEPEIVDSAVLGAYAEPVLLALVLWTLTEKLVQLLEHAHAPSLGSGDLDQLKGHLRQARSTVGSLVGEETETFLDRLIKTVSSVMTMFRHRAVEDRGRAYIPVTSAPITRAANEEDFPARAFGHLAVALSLLSRGHHTHQWTATPDPSTGAVAVSTPSSQRQVFVVRDEFQSLALQISPNFDPTDDEVVLIHADGHSVPQTRVPHSKYGRRVSARSVATTSSPGAIRFGMDEVLDGVTSAEDLFGEFAVRGGFL